MIRRGGNLENYLFRCTPSESNIPNSKSRALLPQKTLVFLTKISSVFLTSPPKNHPPHAQTCLKQQYPLRSSSFEPLLKSCTPELRPPGRTLYKTISISPANLLPPASTNKPQQPHQPKNPNHGLQNFPPLLPNPPTAAAGVHSSASNHPRCGRSRNQLYRS